LKEDAESKELILGNLKGIVQTMFNVQILKRGFCKKIIYRKIAD